MGAFSYYILGNDQRDAALACVARAMMKEPSVHSLKKFVYLDLIEMVEFWMDECSSNNLSVFAFNEEDHRIAGVLLVRDFNFFPKSFGETYSHESKALTPVVQNIGALDEEAIKIFPQLNEGGLGTVADLWLLTVHPDYRGNRIANLLMGYALPLIKNAGFKHSTIEATSYFTSKVAEYHGFKALCSKNVKEILWKGERIFEHIKPPHGEWIYWIRNMKEVNSKDFDPQDKKNILKHSKL